MIIFISEWLVYTDINSDGYKANTVICLDTMGFLKQSKPIETKADTPYFPRKAKLPICLRFFLHWYFVLCDKSD